MIRLAIIYVVCVLVFLPIMVAISCQPKSSLPEAYKVCITQIVTHSELDSTRQGFIDGMTEEGFKEAVNTEYIVENAGGNITTAASIADHFVSLMPDLIYSISTPSSQSVVAAARDTDIPIVFGAVTDPVSAGLVPSWTEAAPYITGVSDWADVTTQILFILDICPQVKILGVIYNPGEINSVMQIEKLTRQIAPEFDLTIVEATVTTGDDVNTAAISLVGKVDAIWIPTDNTAFAAFDSILRVADENSIPLFGSTTAMVEAGAVAGAGVDYYWIGRQCAIMAAKILRGEATPAEITPEKCKYMLFAVNLRAADRMGITIPQAVIDRAQLVIE